MRNVSTEKRRERRREIGRAHYQRHAEEVKRQGPARMIGVGSPQDLIRG